MSTKIVRMSDLPPPTPCLVYSAQLAGQLQGEIVSAEEVFERDRRELEARLAPTITRMQTLARVSLVRDEVGTAHGLPRDRS